MPTIPHETEEIAFIRDKAEKLVELVVNLDPKREGIGSEEDVARFIGEALYAQCIVIAMIDLLAYIYGDRQHYWDEMLRMIELSRNTVEQCHDPDNPYPYGNVH